MADEVKTRKVKYTYRKVKAPKHSHANKQWSIQGVGQQLRFDENGEAEILVSVDGEDVTARFVGDNGFEDIRVDKIAERQAELTLGNTRTETREVPVDDDGGE